MLSIIRFFCLKSEDTFHHSCCPTTLRPGQEACTLQGPAPGLFQPPRSWGSQVSAEWETHVPFSWIMLWVTRPLEVPAKWPEPASKAHTNLLPMSIFFLGVRETKWKLCWGRRGPRRGLCCAVCSTITDTYSQLLWLREELEVGDELRAGLWAVGMDLPHGPLRKSKILSLFTPFGDTLVKKGSQNMTSLLARFGTFSYLDMWYVGLCLYSCSGPCKH